MVLISEFAGLKVGRDFEKRCVMRLLDLYWKSNPDWRAFVDHVQVIRKDAPPEAQKSYQNFLR